MDYEKKYKDALKRARNLHKDAIAMEDTLLAKQCEVIFPELKDSEDKKAIRLLRKLIDNNEILSREDTNTCYAWLEKQGEQNKESDDEKIRKAIICGMNALKEQHKETFASIPINDCIAWLEKQGEQKQEWSKEDEDMLKSILTTCKIYAESVPSSPGKPLLEMQENWLKSLHPLKYWKPTEEQLLNLHYVFSGCSYDIEPLIELEKELKALV